MNLQNFLQAVEQNAARVKKYEQPGDGSDGTCDCIGLIIGAVRLAGGSWKGTHGSNYAARSMVDDFGPAQYYKGEIVFKARRPGEERYNLKDKYKQGGSSYNGDINDYYHVGVVTNDNPLEITHCTSPGPIVRDKKKGKWLYGGRLKGVDYGAIPESKGEITVMEATVFAENGKPVKMRAKPNTSTNVYWEIPNGEKVEVIDNGETWTQIKYKGRTGYMMTKFLIFDEIEFVDAAHAEFAEPVDNSVENSKLTVRYGDLLAIYDKIGELLKQLFVNKGELEKVYDTLGDLLGLRG